MRKYQAEHARLEQYKKSGLKTTEKAADSIATWSGSWNFLMLHIIWFALWLALQLNVGLLTLIVSLEAIILMNVLLMAQTRQAKKDDLRDEADYQADKHTADKMDELIRTIKRIEKKIK